MDGKSGSAGALKALRLPAAYVFVLDASGSASGRSATFAPASAGAR